MCWEGSPFKYRHCVLVLKEGGLPQYDPGVSLEELADIVKGISYPEGSNAIDGNVMGAGLKRPIGIKAAKASEVLMKQKMEERTVKSNQIGDPKAANQERAKAKENKFDMANMYFKMFISSNSASSISSVALARVPF
jgi:hypothetical protein